ncbi:MAG: M3 family oligoendopeptidase [Allobaculum sp.]
MTFSEISYIRPDQDESLNQLSALQKRLEEAADYPAFFEAFKELNTLEKHIQTEMQLASTRHTIDTRDEFYTNECDYFDTISPVLDNAYHQIDAVILNSPYCEQLRNDVPETWFLMHEFAQKTMSSQIIPDLQEENKLASRYQNVVASAQIDFNGEVHTLASLEKYMNDPDQEVRKAAHKAYWGWFATHEQEIGDIFDQLVQIRTKMARKLGYDNYIPFGYYRMFRLDYDRDDVETYRKNVLEDVVPVAMALYKAQAKRHGYDGNTLKAWDEKVSFKSGNPMPKYPEKELVARALQMYQELSPQTGEFFKMMVDQELMDLSAKPGKAAGGYCETLPDYGAPFIFANFNGTNGDIETLTHEAGHGFQAWLSKDAFPFELVWPTSESAEIDSMGMEFFTWPWMKLFFEEDVDKYYYTHLEGTVKFLPYGVLVDHFQHEVYDHPQWNNDERMACWRRLEKQYLPQKDYDEIDFLERGGWWMRQLHIFLDPFYYIDYTLAQVVALQFWSRLQHKDPHAFEDYVAMAKCGGTKPFRELVAISKNTVPFEEGCLKDTMSDVKEWFEKHEMTE